MELETYEVVMDLILQRYVQLKETNANEPATGELLSDYLRCCFILGSDTEKYVKEGEEWLKKGRGADLRLPEVMTFKAAFLAMNASYTKNPISKFTKVNRALNQIDRLEKEYVDQLVVQFVILAVVSKLPAVFARRNQVKRLAYRVNALLDQPDFQSLNEYWTEFAIDFMIRNGLRKNT